MPALCGAENMNELKIFGFDNFIIDDEQPVFDLSVNRRQENLPPQQMEMLLKDINTKLKVLLNDRNKENLRFIKMVLSEVSPALAEQCGEKIIDDYIERRFPDIKNRTKLDFYFNPDNLPSIRQKLENLAIQNGYEGRICLHKDENMRQGECRIVWNDGEELFSTEQILEKIRKQLDGVMEND